MSRPLNQSIASDNVIRPVSGTGLPNRMAGVRKARSRGAWLRLRVQLGGCLFFGALLPYALRGLTLEDFSESAQMNLTLAGSAFAILLGTWLYRSLTTYPGIRASYYILPSFALSYGLVLATFFLARFEYNRLLLLAGFLTSIVWFYIVYAMIQRQRHLRMGVVPFGAVDVLRDVDGVEWLTIESADADVQEVDAIVADLRMDVPSEWDRRLADWALAGTPVYHVKQVHESLTGRVQLEHLSENSFGSLVPTKAYFKIKSLIDFTGAALALLLIWPFFVAVAIAIRLDSPGPAIFRQPRTGYRGVPFTVYKFRTMRAPRGPAGDAKRHAITQNDDDRITRVGRFLRKTRIDELPQLVNVLKGEMSWIGPRPEAVILSQWYEAEIPFYRYRHIVRPGITGWAQVSQGHVAEVDEVRSKLHYDFYYIKNFSPWIDLLIVGRTIKTMITGFGSR